MPKYKVLDSLRHNGKRYKPGTDNDVVAMSEAAAAKIRPGVLKLVDDSAAAEGAGAPAAAGTAAQPAGKKKGAQ